MCLEETSAEAPKKASEEGAAAEAARGPKSTAAAARSGGGGGAVAGGQALIANADADAGVAAGADLPGLGAAAGHRVAKVPFDDEWGSLGDLGHSGVAPGGPPSWPADLAALVDGAEGQEAAPSEGSGPPPSEDTASSGSVLSKASTAGSENIKYE